MMCFKFSKDQNTTVRITPEVVALPHPEKLGRGEMALVKFNGYADCQVDISFDKNQEKSVAEIFKNWHALAYAKPMPCFQTHTRKSFVKMLDNLGVNYNDKILDRIPFPIRITNITTEEIK